jgi:hypothetical protein
MKNITHLNGRKHVMRETSGILDEVIDQVFQKFEGNYPRMSELILC